MAAMPLFGEADPVAWINTNVAIRQHVLYCQFMCIDDPWLTMGEPEPLNDLAESWVFRWGWVLAVGAACILGPLLAWLLATP